MAIVMKPDLQLAGRRALVLADFDIDNTIQRAGWFWVSVLYKRLIRLFSSATAIAAVLVIQLNGTKICVR